MDYKQKLNELLLTTARQNASDLHLEINRNLITKFLITAIFLSGFIFFVNLTNAEEISLPTELKILGTIQGEGTHFEITDSEYLNIAFKSSELIKLRMESIPEMVTMIIEPAVSSSAALAQINLSGFLPLTKYYKYQDDYHNLTEFIADENGQYTYTQDLSKPHFVFIQPRASTKFIKDDTTGGDCYLIGTWNIITKTCILSQDVYETIQIDSNGIILDGDNYTIFGNNTGFGIYLPQKTNVILENLNINQFTNGIYLFSSSNNTLINNIVNNNSATGIIVNWYSNNNNLINNIANYNRGFGINVSSYSNNNIISNNTANNNNLYGIYLYFDTHYNNLANNIANSNDIGIYPYRSNSNTLINNTVSFNRAGIYLVYSSNNKIYNNNLINNSTQISIYGGSGNILNLDKPIGGNYFSNYDTPEKNCFDLNNDNFCDSPYVFSGGQDNLPWTKQDGWKIPANQPPTISNPWQFKSDNITQIPENGVTTEDIVVFKAVVTDPDDDQIKLQIELKEFNQPFDGQNLLESGFVNSGSEAVVSRGSLVVGSYKWRARAVDDKSNVSEWQEFGTVGNVDFIVKTLEQAAADLAKEVINAPYLGDGDTYGGKGWDSLQSLYVSSNEIFNGYNYWNNNIKKRKIEFGVGLDCSGLTQWAFNRSFDPQKSLLRNVIRYDGADGQYKNNTETVAEVDLQPGDLLFFDGEMPVGEIDHVAMYVGLFIYSGENRDIVEAHSPARGIIASSKDDLKILPEFLVLGSDGFRRVALSPSIGGQVKAGSPIDLIVTDPDGFTIAPTTAIQTSREYLREIPGELYYTENVLGADGRPEDIVYWPTQKAGDYVIKAIPETGISPTETYNLEFQVGNQTILLANNVSISQSPVQGYGISITETGTLNSFVPVLIDIKPDSYPNSINLSSNGVVPIAVFGFTTFDVKQIDLTTIKLANAGVKLKGNGQPMASYEDVNKDGITDVIVHISTNEFQLTAADIKAELNGDLLDGKKIKGFDSVRIVP